MDSRTGAGIARARIDFADCLDLSRGQAVRGISAGAEQRSRIEAAARWVVDHRGQDAGAGSDRSSVDHRQLADGKDAEAGERFPDPARRLMRPIVCRGPTP